MPEECTPTDDAPRGVAAATLAAVHAGAIGTLLFGDYLALSLSRALTGSPNNWLLFVAVLQSVALLLSLLTGSAMRRPPLAVVVGYAGLCTIGLGHAIPLWLAGDGLGEYGDQKLAALFLMLGPALGCGFLIGSRRELVGARGMPWLMAPLLAACTAAVATDPSLLTIAYYADPPVWLDVLVMPTHQALAFSLAKAALLLFALECADGPTGWHRLLRLGALGALLGLVLLTGARGYTVALLAALACQALVRGRRLAVALVCAALALGLYQAFGSEFVQDRFDPAQLMESIAYREREQAWQAAWTSFVDHPLFGVGPGGFAGVLGWYGRAYPHNLLLEVASEFGIAGLCCLAAMLWPALRLLGGAACGATRLGVAAVFGIGFCAFGFGGSLTVGDLIRNQFLFLGVGICATAIAVPAPRRAQAAAIDLRLQPGCGGT